MSPLRILHLNSLLTGGGTDDRSVRVAHALLRLGHSVWMAGPAGREFSKVSSDLSLPFCPVSEGPFKLSLIFNTAQLIRRLKIQILHARHGRDYWPAILAARLSARRPKVVLSRHLAKSPSSWASRRFLLSQCDALAAVSEYVAKVLREGDDDPLSDNPERHHRPPMIGDFSKIHVVYGGFDMDRFQPRQSSETRELWGLKPEHYIFGVVGGYDLPRGKGQTEFLRAASQIKDQVPHARFLIIGRGNMKEILEAQIAQLNLQASAQLTPYSTNMPATMNALDCMVLPQVGTEALGGVVLEAHACGKPVIASALDGIPEAFAVGGYGQLIERGSVEALARAMLDWARRPALPMPAQWDLHQKVAQRFSLERTACDLVDLYQSLLKPAP